MDVEDAGERILQRDHGWGGSAVVGGGTSLGQHRPPHADLRLQFTARKVKTLI